MKIVILAGGLGTRLSEYTHSIPKPMVKIGKLPIVVHIMSHYLRYGFSDFILATGYKSFVFKKYFKNFEKSSKPFNFQIKKKTCKVNIVDTGLNTLTGGRLKKIGKYLENDDDFMFTYGDGISSVNLKKLLNFHKKNKRLITVTAVRPPARFGEIVLSKNKVKSFKEKPQLKNNWINGGFFIFNSKIFNFISGDNIMLEREPFQKLTRSKNLMAFKHNGFWQCMDTMRDKNILVKMIKEKKAPWLKLKKR